MASSIRITVASVFWEVCPDCGHPFPNAVRLDEEDRRIPGTEVGHRVCPAKRRA